MRGHCVRIPGMGIVCGVRPQRPRCSVGKCRRRATARCDYPLENAGCDDPVCDDHRVTLVRGASGSTLDLCLRHASADWPCT